MTQRIIASKRIFISIILVLYNRLVKAKNSVKRAESGIDVVLKQRFDVIPNLVECVKGYTKHEKETLTEITKLRTSFAQEANQADADELNNHYEKLIALAEAYPEIKAGENYLQLRKTQSFAEALRDVSAKIPFSYSKYPEAAIIAALSPQSESGGTTNFTPCFLHIFSRDARRCEFAATPPARTSVSSPVCPSAASVCLVTASTIFAV
jgi:hypothetical protein